MSSYRYQLISHNTSGFDNAIVLIFLSKEYTNKNMKLIKTSGGFLKLGFRVGTVYENDKKNSPIQEICLFKSIYLRIFKENTKRMKHSTPT